VWFNYIGETMNGKCTCCNVNNISFINFDCGHVISERLGGANTLNNLRPICRLCNNSMGIKNMNEFIQECGFNMNNF
jgi:hypothetical protein